MGRGTLSNSREKKAKRLSRNLRAIDPGRLGSLSLWSSDIERLGSSGSHSEVTEHRDPGGVSGFEALPLEFGAA
jgi:hypothetical protein